METLAEGKTKDKNKDKKILVLIDGHAILHRAYHAIPPLTTRTGQLVNAVYGFCTMMFRIIQELKPKYIAVTFDTEKPTFRHTAYVGYQAQRPRLESELAEQIKIVQEVLQAMDVPIYIAPGFEADDVIGTLTKQAQSPKFKAQNLEVIVVSGDRDFLQLVGKNVKVYAPIKGLSEARVFDEAVVKEHMGVEPAQIVDYKALMGDASDNYPGVPGIGPKTASTLLAKYRTLEGVYKNLNKIEQPLVDKLAQGHQSALLSQKLAKISTEVSVELDLKASTTPKLVGNERLIAVLRELGFKSLVSRLQPTDVRSQKPKKRKSQDQLRLVS